MKDCPNHRAGLCKSALLALLLGMPALAHASDITTTTGKAVLVTLARPAAQLFIADAGVATASGSGVTLFITGRATGETSWIASDAAGRIIDKGAVRVRHDEAGLASGLAAALPGSAITVSTARDMLVLSGSVASATEADDAMRMAARFVPGGEIKQVMNRMAISTPVQINLKVRVAEVSRQVVKALGFNWQALGSFGNASIGLATGNPVLAANGVAAGAGGFTKRANGVAAGAGGCTKRANGVDNLFAAFRNGSVDLNALIDALEDKKLVTVLAEPSLTALSGTAPDAARRWPGWWPQRRSGPPSANARFSAGAR